MKSSLDKTSFALRVTVIVLLCATFNNVHSAHPCTDLVLFRESGSPEKAKAQRLCDFARVRVCGKTTCSSDFLCSRRARKSSEFLQFHKQL